jgi:hypothetical protein
MKKADVRALAIVIVCVMPFFLFKPVMETYLTINAYHPYVMAFLKFAILATFGEMLALRIKSGVYYVPGFGAVSKMIVWGFLGVWIAFAMKVFATGVPVVIEKAGMLGLSQAMQEPFSMGKLMGAFCISVAMNTSFAPIFMTVHKITDTHIQRYHGHLRCLIILVDVKGILSKLNWDVQWNFVFKKTIPLFWIPAHTLTFILPADFQVLFAALLSVALGLILTFASLKANK